MILYNLYSERRFIGSLSADEKADMDGLVEQVVRKEKDLKYYLNFFLIIFAAIGIPAIMVFFGLVTGPRYLIVAAFFASLFCIYGVWFFVTSLKVDYEYAALGSSLRFDRVIAKRRRKPIIKFDIKSASDFFRYTDEEMSKHKFSKVYRASAREFSEDNYVMVFRHEARGECAVIFTPSETMIEAIKPFFSAELKKKLYFNKK